MLKVLAGTGAVLAATIVGAAAFVYSPAGCSCTDTWMDYVVLAKLSGGDGLEDITAGRLQAGLLANLKGEKLTIGQYALGEKYGCVQQSPHVVACHSVFETSALLSKGFDVVYTLDSRGVVSDVRVTSFLELHPNNSFKPNPLRGSA